MVVFLTEMIPVKLRATGFSLAYSLAAALFGGFSPAIATALIRHTGDKAMPGAWLSVAAVMGLAATLLARAHEEDAGSTSPA